jgi:regulator of sirC expression with transglutaminase-like and TPR domain
MKIKELNSLLKLIDDPDPNIFEVVNKKIIDSGISIVPLLEKAWEEEINSSIQIRIEDIIQQIQFNELQLNLQEWKDDGYENLLYGASLIAKYQYPDLQFSDIEEKINLIKKDVWLEINDNLTALEKVKIINHVLYDIHGLTRNNSNLHSPQNYYINNVLELKKGNPVTLAIIYAAVSQELGLPIYGINLPKNFILAYQDELFMGEKDEEESILFYINPYNKGAVFGKKEIEYFIEQQKLEVKKSYYIPCTNLEIINRLINSLIETYDNLGYLNKVEELKELMKSLN